MSVNLSQGTQIAIASAYGSTKTMSAISNATEAVATLEASHGITTNDIFEVTSGWDRLDGRVVRAKGVATNDVTLESIDTSSTTLYPAGSGTGTIREITTWTTITQITDASSDTPAVQFADITTLANTTRKKIPTLDEAPTFNFRFLYDLSLSWLSAALAASDTNALTAIRMITPAGAKIYANGYIKVSRFPQVAVGEVMKSSLTMTFVSIPTGYTS